MIMVDDKRADVRRLVDLALSEASLKNKRIETIDPLVKCAKRLFPFYDESEINKYARTALRIILLRPQTETFIRGHQTTLSFDVPSMNRITDSIYEREKSADP